MGYSFFVGSAKLVHAGILPSNPKACGYNEQR
jgi:hypothetical protein